MEFDLTFTEIGNVNIDPGINSDTASPRRSIPISQRSAIQVENPDGRERGVSRVEMDGRRVPDGMIPLQRDLVKHRILVRMGKPPYDTPHATRDDRTASSRRADGNPRDS